MKHSFHSRMRIGERSGDGISVIKKKINKKDYIVLEKQQNNVIMGLIKFNDKKAMVAAWSVKPQKIITVISVQQYLERHNFLIIDEKLKKELLKYYSVEREGPDLKCKIGDLIKCTL